MPEGAIVGYGTIALGHLRAYVQVPRLRVTSVVDPTASRRLAATQAGLKAYASLEELFARGPVEFLDICSPPDSHHHYIREAVARQVPVVCEKPVFVPSECGYDEILQVVRESQSVVYPCQNYKFAAVFDQVSELIREGALGDVQRVEVRILRSGHALGVPEFDRDWRRRPEQSFGGILRDHGPHALYLALSLAGLRPTEVSCLLGTMSEDGPWETEDTALVHLRCANGAEADLSFSWASARRSSRYAFVGTRGFVTVNDDILTVARAGVVDNRTVTSDFNDSSHAAWFVDMLREFDDLMSRWPESRIRIRSALDEAVLTSVTIDAAYASAAQQGVWLPVGSP